MNKKPNKAGFALTSLSAIILSAALTGCLSGGGGSSSSAPADPSTPSEPQAPQVTTEQGEFSGINLNGINVFRGIRYAEPPVGELRFAAPEPVAAHEGVIELSEDFGNMCPQSDISTGAVQGNEDCLFLNVYAPADAENLPVMVWVHGGAFIFGNGGGEYDPTRLVNEDVIVVTLNYRLGHLGFLAHPELGAGDGNFGLMDQREALRWVKNNIAAFGGNPDMVTLFGESAGGHSVMSHIARSGSEGSLFQRAIVQSGSYAQDQIPLATAQMIGLGVEAAARGNFAETCAADLPAADCLRALSPEQILQLQDGQSIPTAGGSFLPSSIRGALAAGEIDTSLDIMIGSNQNEGTLFVALDELQGGLVSLDAQGLEEYRSRVADFLSPYLAAIPFDVTQIGDDYLARFEGNPSQLSLALSALWTDFMFACPSAGQAGTFAAANMDTYKYWFRDINAPWTLVPPAVPVPGVGEVPISFPLDATHAGEIPYVLYPQNIMEQRYTGDAEDLAALAGNMVTFWTQFAKYGDPNASDGTTTPWPQFSSGEVMQLTPELDTPGISAFAEYHWCRYWAEPPLAL